MNLDIIAGNLPDLIELSDIPFANFANKGLFEDLNPFIDADQEITLVPAFRKVLLTDDYL
jgi:ABC-type glycerol-3-phosphate transport system substrate-binding protein